MKKIISIMLAVCVLLALCACGSKKDDNKKNNMQTDNTSLYEYAQKLEENGDNEAAAAQTMFEALCEYAKRLEDAGNYEAAQQVYAQLPKAVAGAAVADIEAGIADTTYGKYFAGMQNLNKWEDLIESVGDAQ